MYELKFSMCVCVSDGTAAGTGGIADEPSGMGADAGRSRAAAGESGEIAGRNLPAQS